MIAGGARASAGTWFALATVLLVNAAFVLNNLAPYLGLNYAGAMTMFSGITVTADNHLFMPKLRLFDAGTYVTMPERKARDLPRSAAETIDRLLRSGNERPQLHLNVARYHFSRACASSPTAGLAVTLITDIGQRLDYDDICTEPSMLRYDVLTSRRPCNNRACTRALRVLRADNPSWLDDPRRADDSRADDAPTR